MANALPTPDEARELLADGVLNIPESLKFAGCGRTTLYAAIAADEIKGVVKHGRRTAIAKRGLIDWMARRMRRA